MITTTHPPVPRRVGKTGAAAFTATRRDFSGLHTLTCDVTAQDNGGRPCTAKLTVQVKGARDAVAARTAARAEAAERGWSFEPLAGCQDRGHDYCPSHTSPSGS